MRFGTICADPPWSFTNKASRAAATNHYGTLPVAGVCNFHVDGVHVSKLMRSKSHCYLWVPSALIEDGLAVMRAWGFDFKHHIAWIKTKGGVRHDRSCIARDACSCPPRVQIGLGNYWRHSNELCLFGTRGGAKALVHNLPNTIFAPRGEHSAKPEELQDGIERISPGPFIELFARRRRPSWTCHGLDLV